jgi:hypothetical protein
MVILISEYLLFRSVSAQCRSVLSKDTNHRPYSTHLFQRSLNLLPERLQFFGPSYPTGPRLSNEDHVASAFVMRVFELHLFLQNCQYRRITRSMCLEQSILLRSAMFVASSYSIFAFRTTFTKIH